MQTALIVFSSSTTASRLKRLAHSAQAGDVSLTQSPKSVSQNGCTYALRVPMEQLSDVLELANRYDIKHGKVYREARDREGRSIYYEL